MSTMRYLLTVVVCWIGLGCGNDQPSDTTTAPPTAEVGDTTAVIASDEWSTAKVDSATLVPTTAPVAVPRPSSTTPPAPATSSAPQPATATSTPAPTTPPPAPAPATKPDHSAWDALLGEYVSSSGRVNYAGLSRVQSRLEAYTAALGSNPPQGDWSRNEAMAYWINAYNAFTVQLILENWPVKSIKDISGGKPWDVKWIRLGDKDYSLNQIEHDIIRPRYKDARIHFALNCAAKSCPPLHNRAFTAANLNATLETLTRQFINSEQYNQITSDGAAVSQLFDWYASDFGDVRAYLNRYATATIAPTTDIKFTEYNWALNN